jgi:hypothetical protein
VEPARVIAGVRVALSSSAADTYGEIDAVGALPSRVCSSGRAFGAPASWMRLPPSAAGEPTVTGAVWAREVVRRSSQDSRDRAATQALGAPNVYPRYGDLPGAWAPSSNDAKVESIELRFPPTATREIHVYETYGVGGVWMVEDLTSGSPVAVWADAPTRVGPGEPRVLRIVLPQPRTIAMLRGELAAGRAVVSDGGRGGAGTRGRGGGEVDGRQRRDGDGWRVMG